MEITEGATPVGDPSSALREDMKKPSSTPTDFPIPVPIRSKNKTPSTTSSDGTPEATDLPREAAPGSDSASPISSHPEEGQAVRDGKGASVEASEKEPVELPPPRPKPLGRPGASSEGSGYRPPTWAPEVAPTNTGLSLTVLKGGVEVNSISLDNRTHCLLGRQQGVVDVLLEHPSISRQHAVLQHGDKGSVFLFDNGSTHGCMVNKNKVVPKEYHRLSVGDVIKFGESTRLYVLEGPQELLPAEYESDNLRNLRQEAARKQLAAKLAKIKAGGAAGARGEGDSGEYGISWGFDEDAVAEASDEEEEEGMEGADGEVELPEYLKTEAQKRRRRDTKSGLSADSVHKRDAKLFEKLQLKLAKVERLVNENERITAKEGSQGGLTDGQQAQLARNDKTIETVRLQIEEIEESIRQKNKARERGTELDEGGGNAAGGKASKKEPDGAEDDDFYDRTAPIKPSSDGTNDGGIASKKAEVRARRFARKDKIKKLGSTISAGVLPSTQTAAGAGEATVSGDGGEGGGNSVPMTLEALTRRSEVVADDLARTEERLAELEAEEAKEALEDIMPDGDVVADPLDAFMASNRTSARQQAHLRLSAQRDALRQEQARLVLMVEAAQPSMPQLKSITPTAAAIGKTAGVPNDGAKADEVPGAEITPPQPRKATQEVEPQLARSAEGKPNSVMPPPPSFTRVMRTPAGQDKTDSVLHVAIGREADEPGKLSSQSELRARNLKPKGGSEPDERRPGSARPPLARAVMPSSSPAALARPSAAHLPRPSVGSDTDGQQDSDAAMSTVGGSSDDDVTLSGEKEEVVHGGDGSVSGVKRRGTPVGAVALLHPSKRPQRGEASSSTESSSSKAETMAADESFLQAGGDKAIRTVKGPTMLSPSLEKTPLKLKAAKAGVALGSKGVAAKAAGDGVLEGGDADWVPPKGQAGDGRTALNLKFGY